MKTYIYKKEDLPVLCELLKKGKVIAFPTDTVFGLGVIYDNEKALEALKQAKGRPESKPIPMMVSSLQQIEEVAYVDEKVKKLIVNFMPGAFTLVLKSKESLPAFVNNGLKTIAIRMPNDKFVLELIQSCDKPLLVSSANLSDFPSCSKSEEVLKQLNGRIDGLVEGESNSTMASTIVAIDEKGLTILRSGIISEEEIRKIWEE